MQQSVIEVIKEIVEVDFNLPVENITLDTKLVDIGIDSLESFNMLYSLERTYDIRFDNKFTPETVGELVDEIERLRKEE